MTSVWLSLFFINALFKTRNPASSSAIAHIHSQWLRIINLSKSMKRRKKILLSYCNKLRWYTVFRCLHVSNFIKNISISVYISNSTTYETKENDNLSFAILFFFFSNLVSQNLCPTDFHRILFLLSKLLQVCAVWL